MEKSHNWTIFCIAVASIFLASGRGVEHVGIS